MAPDDYIHRVGRTGRAEMTGEAFTFVSSEEEGALRAIERAIGRTLLRVTVPDFDYKASASQLEVPRGERIAAIRAQRTAQRQRAAKKTTLTSARRGNELRTGRPHPGPRPSGRRRP